MKPKRYVLFMFDSSPGYQAIGGWNDMKDSFDELDELGDYLKAFATDPKSWRWDHIEVLDLETGGVVDLSPPPPPPRPRRKSIFGFEDYRGGADFPFEDDDDFEFEGPGAPLPTVANGTGKKGKRGRRGRKARR